MTYTLIIIFLAMGQPSGSGITPVTGITTHSIHGFKRMDDCQQAGASDIGLINVMQPKQLRAQFVCVGSQPILDAMSAVVIAREVLSGGS